MTPAAQAGQMLASAVFYGALLDRIWWGRWLDAAQRGPKLVDDLVWLDLEPIDPLNTGPLSQPRRWFADPLTRTLLAHWHSRQTAPVQQSAAECLCAFFNWAGDSSELVGMLVDHAQLHWQFRMPKLLVGHALGKQRAVPVSIEDWRRLLGCKLDSDKVVREPNNPGRRPFSCTWCETQKRVLRHASFDIRHRRISRLAAKTKAAGELSKLDPAPAAEELMNSWCIEALTFDRGKQQRGFMPGTVKSYFDLLTKHVVEEYDDLLEMTAEDLIDRFDERLAVIEKSGLRLRILKAVRSLYEHMRRQRVDLPTFPLLLEAHATEQRAWANLVSPAEYLRALEQCWNADQQICLVLGFRCGLRLGEVLGLTAHDFFLDDKVFELTVVRNEHRNLKTPTSRRILPLNKLLDPGELELVQKHLAERIAALGIAPGNNLLIHPDSAVAGDKTKRPSPKKALDKIVGQATSMPITYHHLRHSFTSYLLATMLLPDECRDARVPEPLRSVISARRKADLVETLLGKQKLGQHALHAVSAMLGHIVSETTLRSYAHLLDLSVLHYVCRPSVEPVLPRDEVRVLTGRGYDRRSTLAANERLSAEIIESSSSYAAPAASSAPLSGSPDLVRVSEWRGRRLAQREHQFLIGRRRQAQASGFRAKDGLRIRYPDWRHIAGVLGGAPKPDTEQLFGIMSKSWSEAAGEVFGLRLRSGKLRHQPDVEVLLRSRKWAAYVDTRWHPDRRLTHVERRALFHAITYWDGARSEVRFQSRPLAVAWRNLLISLGFSRAEVEISVKGMRFRARPSGELHNILANAHDLPGTAATRGRRGSIAISFRGDGKSDRQVRSAGHFVMLLLAIREGYRAAVRS